MTCHWPRFPSSGVAWPAASRSSRIGPDTMMPVTLTFRFAEARDVPAIVTLVESAYRGDASREGWTTEADLLDGNRTDIQAVESVLAAPGSVMLLAEADRQLTASCHPD